MRRWTRRLTPGSERAAQADAGPSFERLSPAPREGLKTLSNAPYSETASGRSRRARPLSGLLVLLGLACLAAGAAAAFAAVS